ncbi:MAG: hypothetical protein ABSE53_00585 [Terracidiphilus sp.]|jgi:hypothetical protein
MTIPVGMDVGAGTGVGVGTGPGAGKAVSAAIAALERAGGAATRNETTAFAPGKGTGASWVGAAKGNEQPAAGNESFQASWHSMLRAWGVVAKATSGAADQIGSDEGEIGAANGSNERPNVASAQATFVRAGAEAVESELTTNRSNGPAVGAGAPANSVARTIGAQGLPNSFGAEAGAQSVAAIRAATGSGSSTGVSAGANAKSERRAGGGEDAGAHPREIPAANGQQTSGVDGVGLAVTLASVQPQIAPANLADSLDFRPSKQIDEPLSDASETEPESAIAAIQAKGVPWTTAASPGSNSSASTHAASQVPASSAQSTMRVEETSGGAAVSVLRDEEMSGSAAVPIGDQEEFAAQPQISTAAPAIAAAGTSRAGSATRQRVQGASSSVEEHKTLSGEFGAHRGVSSVSGVSANPAVATASADKMSADSSNSRSGAAQVMARSAHGAVASGVSAATGQGMATNVVVGQTSAPEASAWARDPGNVHGTAGAMATVPGDSTLTQAAVPQETFAALDSGTAVGTPNWIHTGGRQAEAGFEDPALGWVGVRADLSGGSLHAALVPGSTEAAQALSGHLAGLNAYLQEQQTPVATLTMAAPGMTGLESSVDQSMQQSAGQHGEQDPAAAQQSGAQPGVGASASATAMSATAANGGFNAIAYAGGSRGTHISVMA